MEGKWHKKAELGQIGGKRKKLPGGTLNGKKGGHWPIHLCVQNDQLVGRNWGRWLKGVADF
jgi:hypothetical protein